MRTIIKLTIFSSIIFSLNTFASVSELASISLNSGEVIAPARDIESVSSNSIQLFDGRTIDNTEIKNIEINDSNGSTKIIFFGRFKIINIEAAKVGGDATGGG